MNPKDRICPKCKRECPAEFNFCPCGEPLTKIAKENKKLKEKNIEYREIIDARQSIDDKLDNIIKSYNDIKQYQLIVKNKEEDELVDKPNKKLMWILIVAFAAGIILYFIMEYPQYNKDTLF